MDPFTVIGLGIGLGFAWFMRDLEPLGGSGAANTASGSVNEDVEAANEPSCSDTANIERLAPPVASTVHRSTQLLTDEESHEAAEALRSALERRR